MEDNRRATLPSSVSNDPTSTQSATRVCVYFNRPRGCMYGDRCRYLHVANVESREAGSEEKTQDSFHNARSNLDQPPNRQSTQDPKRRQQRIRPHDSNNSDQKAEKHSAKNQGGGGRSIKNKVRHHADPTHNEPMASRGSPSPSPLTQPSPSHSDQYKEHTGREDDSNDVSYLHSLLQFPQIGSECASHYHHYHQQHRYHQHHLTHAHQHPQQQQHLRQQHQHTHSQHHRQHPHHRKQHQQHPHQQHQQHSHQQHQHQKQQPQHQQQYNGPTLSRPDTVTSGSSTAERGQTTTGSRSFSNHVRGQARRGPTSEFSLGDLLVRSTMSTTRQPVARPPTAQSANLFATEMQQLALRFRDNLQISEKSSRQHVYKIQFEPTDPEWVSSDHLLSICINTCFYAYVHTYVRICTYVQYSATSLNRTFCKLELSLSCMDMFSSPALCNCCTYI